MRSRGVYTVNFFKTPVYPKKCFVNTQEGGIGGSGIHTKRTHRNRGKMVQCSGLTKKGAQCRNKTAHVTGLCHCHRPKTAVLPTFGTGVCASCTRTGRKCTKPVMFGTNGIWCVTHNRTFIQSVRWFPQYTPTDNLDADARMVRNIPAWIRPGTTVWYAAENLRHSVHVRSVECYRKVLMASRIKRYFLRSMSNPQFKMCRDRLMREFNSMDLIEATPI